MHPFRAVLLAPALLSLAACREARAPALALEGSVSLTESVPSESSLAPSPFLATDAAWLGLVDRARTRLDLAFFYASDAPPSRLTPIVEAIVRARRRGVHVRAVFEKVFLKQYPIIPEHFRRGGIDVRLCDRSATTGGIVHTKMMARDGVEAWVGSANFDWRSLEHIHELGVLVANKALAEHVHALVGMDMTLADDQLPAVTETLPVAKYVHLAFNGGAVDAAFGASPRGWLPEGTPWDWPELQRIIDEAKRTLTIELMSYGTHMRDGSTWTALDDALRRAADRGVAVTLVVSSWAATGKHRESLAALQHVGVRVRVVTIAPHSSGPIPFARVIHGKAVAADGEQCWVGTSNGEGDYFLKSRNAGFFLRSIDVCAALQRRIDAIAAGPEATDFAASSGPELPH